MKNYTHSQQRASERYNIEDFNKKRALNEILDDRCIQIEEDYEKYSRTFLIRYVNRYVVLVTDFNVSFIKTCLPFKNEHFDFVNALISKLSAA
ncbi:hypothetical protein IKQ26_00105 [bacterium]|nr:hypothetical protein [bacterium]